MDRSSASQIPPAPASATADSVRDWVRLCLGERSHGADDAAVTRVTRSLMRLLPAMDQALAVPKPADADPAMAFDAALQALSRD